MDLATYAMDQLQRLVLAFKDTSTDTPDVFVVNDSRTGRPGLAIVAKGNGSTPDERILLYAVHDDGSPLEKEVQLARDGMGPLSGTVQENDTDRWLDELTERENEVIQHLAQGLLYKEIADRLSVSHFTVKNHVRNIYGKLHVSTRVEAVNRYFGR